MQTLTNMKKRKGGFTLIELIVVIAILAIIALIAIPKFMGFQENAKEKADISDAKNLHTVVSTLLANQTITAPSITTDYDMVQTANPSDTVVAAIEKGMDSVPKLKSAVNTPSNTAGGDFHVTITSSGAVRVWNQKATSPDAESPTSASGILYPYPG